MNTCPPSLCTGKASDEKLKINELGPHMVFENHHTLGSSLISAAKIRKKFVIVAVDSGTSLIRHTRHQDGFLVMNHLF